MAISDSDSRLRFAGSVDNEGRLLSRTRVLHVVIGHEMNPGFQRATRAYFLETEPSTSINGCSRLEGISKNSNETIDITYQNRGLRYDDTEPLCGD